MMETENSLTRNKFFGDALKVINVSIWQHLYNKDTGGLGNTPSNPDFWTTAGLLYALSETHIMNFRDPKMKKALKWLLDNINEDGGGPHRTKSNLSFTEPTEWAILTLCNVLMEFADLSHRKKEEFEISVKNEYEKTLAGLAKCLLDSQTMIGGWTCVCNPSNKQKERAYTYPTALGAFSLRRVLDYLETEDNSLIHRDLTSLQERLKNGYQESIKCLSNLKDKEIPDMQNEVAWGESNDSPNKATVAHSAFVLYIIKRLPTDSLPKNLLDNEQVISFITRYLESKVWIENVIDLCDETSPARFSEPYVISALLEGKKSFDDETIQKGLIKLFNTYYWDEKGLFFYRNQLAWPNRDCMLMLNVLAQNVNLHDMLRAVERQYSYREKIKEDCDKKISDINEKYKQEMNDMRNKYQTEYKRFQYTFTIAGIIIYILSFITFWKLFPTYFFSITIPVFSGSAIVILVMVVLEIMKRGK